MSEHHIEIEMRDRESELAKPDVDALVAAARAVTRNYRWNGVTGEVTITRERHKALIDALEATPEPAKPRRPTVGDTVRVRGTEWVRTNATFGGLRAGDTARINKDDHLRLPYRIGRFWYAESDVELVETQAGDDAEEESRNESSQPTRLYSVGATYGDNLAVYKGANTFAAMPDSDTAQSVAAELNRLHALAEKHRRRAKLAESRFRAEAERSERMLQKASERMRQEAMEANEERRDLRRQLDAVTGDMAALARAFEAIKS